MNRGKIRLTAFGIVAALCLSVTFLPLSAGLPPVAAQGACHEWIVNGGFENGHTPWIEQSKLQMELLDPFYPHTGTMGAWLGGANKAEDSLTQTVTLPSDTGSLTLRIWWAVFSEEPPGAKSDFARSELLRPNGSLITTTLTINNESAEPWLWNEAVADLTAYAGQTVQLRLSATNDTTSPSSFFFDDVSIVACPQEGTPTPTATGTSTIPPTATPWPRLFLPLLLR